MFLHLSKEERRYILQKHIHEVQIWAAIDHFLRSPSHNKPFSIISNAVFTRSNKVLNTFFTLENFQSRLFALYLTG